MSDDPYTCACHPDPRDEQIVDRYYRSQRRRALICRLIGHKPVDSSNYGGDVSTTCDRCWQEVA